MKLENILNIAIIGNNSSGKTSLTESILYKAGIINRMGTIENGNTVSDYNEDEIERKISINMSVISFEYNNKKINLLDTPGYPDFLGDMLAGIKISEVCVFVIDLNSVIDAQIENILDLLIENKKCVLFFLNKLDKTSQEIQDVENRIQEIETRMGIKLTLLNVPTKDKKLLNVLSPENPQTKKYYEKLIDTIASSDDKLTEKYLETAQLSEQELIDGLKNGFRQHKIYPVLCGSAIQTIGVDSLLEFICNFTPEPETIKNTDSFCGLIFKTISEPGMGQMNYVKIYSGEVSPGMDIYNQTKHIQERIGQLCFLQGKKRIDTTKILAGDIGVLIKLKETRTNDIITDIKFDKNLMNDFQIIKFPESLYSMGIHSKSKGEEEKIGNALANLIIEDPTLKFQYNAETKEVVISGLGSLQLEIMLNRMKRRYGVEVELMPPKIPYKETIRSKAEVQGKYKRQSGGRGQYGDCWLRIEPKERGGGFEFINKIFGGAIPKNYIPAVEKGVIEAMNEGVIAGYPIVDIRVTLYDGSYHEVDSSDMAFKIAGAMALRKGVLEAQPYILEPIMNMEIIIPEEYLGAVMGDLNARRGRILGMDHIKKRTIVKAQVPLSEISNYTTDLRSLTKGAGKFNIHFSHYEELPSYISQSLIEQYKKKIEQGR